MLSKGAGHLEHTALPIGGKSTHSVISAHSAWPGQTFFDYLDTLEIGDEFYIKVLDRVLKYEVDDINVVLPDQTRNLYVVEGEDYLTLLTCTPYSVNTHRLLVRGKRVPYEMPEDPDTVITDSSTYQEGYLYLFGYKLSYTVVAVSIIVFVAFVVTVTVLIVRIRKFRSKKKGEGQ